MLFKSNLSKQTQHLLGQLVENDTAVATIFEKMMPLFVEYIQKVNDLESRVSKLEAKLQDQSAGDQSR